MPRSTSRSRHDPSAPLRSCRTAHWKKEPPAFTPGRKSTAAQWSPAGGRSQGRFKVLPFQSAAVSKCRRFKVLAFQGAGCTSRARHGPRAWAAAPQARCQQRVDPCAWAAALVPSLNRPWLDQLRSCRGLAEPPAPARPRQPQPGDLRGGPGRSRRRPVCNSSPARRWQGRPGRVRSDQPPFC